MDVFANICSIIGAVAAIGAWWQLWMQKKENKRLDQIVTMVLQCTKDNRKITPMMLVRRKDITRAELQGILGTIKMLNPKERYSIEYISTSAFWDNIKHLQASDNDHDILVIPCTPTEIDQFDPSVIVSGERKSCT